MSFGMFEAAVAGDKENEHQKKLAKTRLAQAAAEVDQKLGSFLSKATSKSDYIERVRLAENDFREIVGKYLEGDTGFKAVATKMVDHYVKKNTKTSARRVVAVDWSSKFTDDWSLDGSETEYFVADLAANVHLRAYPEWDTWYWQVWHTDERGVRVHVGRGPARNAQDAMRVAEEKGVEFMTNGKLASRRVAFTDIQDIKSHVEGLGVKTRKKGDGFTFPAASGAKGYITVRPNGEIVVETIIGGAGGFQSIYAPNEMDLVERWIEKTVGGSYRMSSRRHANGETHFVHDNGVVEVFDADAYLRENPNADIVTDGYDGRMWDDSVSTSWTPAPGGRSPFEYDRYSSRRHASSVYELAGELARQTGRSEQEMEEALILYLEQMESLDGVSYDEDNLPSEARDFLTEAVLHGIAAGDFRSAKVRRRSNRRHARRRTAEVLVDQGSGLLVEVMVDENGNETFYGLSLGGQPLTAELAAAEGINDASDYRVQRDGVFDPADLNLIEASRKRRSNRRRVALLPDEFNVDGDSAMSYDAEAGMFVDVQPGDNGYEWNLYWDSGSDYTNVTQDLADSGSAGSLEEAIEQAAHEVSQYSPDDNPFRQSARKRRSNRRTARGVDFSRSTYDLFEDGSGDSWYDLVDTEENSYDSDDLDEVVQWLKQDGLLPFDGRLDTYTSDSYEDPYTSQRYEDSAALRGFTDEELHEIKRRMSSRRASRGRRPFDRVAGGYDWGDKDYQGYPWPDYYTDEDKESEWLEFAQEHPGNLYDIGDTLEDEDFLRAPFGTSVTVPTDDFDGEGNPGEFDLVKDKGGNWRNPDFKADLHWSEIGQAPVSGLPENRRRRAAITNTNERFPGTNEMFERAGWQSTDPERSEWLSPSGYAMYDGSEGSVFYFDPDDTVSNFYTLEDEEFGDDLPQRLTDDEEYQSRLWEY